MDEYTLKIYYSDPEAQIVPEGDRVEIKPRSEAPITSKFTGKMSWDEARVHMSIAPSEMRPLATLCPLCFSGIIL